jgi:hypothetical protein
VAFTVRDVEDDPDAYDALIAAGFRSVPVTFVGKTAVRGYDRPALCEALGLLANAAQPDVGQAFRPAVPAGLKPCATSDKTPSQ